MQPPDRILVIEPDPELREILMAEIRRATSMRVVGAGLDECSRLDKLTGSKCVALYDHAEHVRDVLPPAATCQLLHSGSVPGMLAACRTFDVSPLFSTIALFSSKL